MEDLDFLVQHGMSLDEIHRLVGDGIPLGEIVESAKRIVERGDPLTADAQQVPSPPKLTTISAVSLQQKNIPPVRWIMQGMLPAGLTILASPPKFGKSWLAMTLCLATAAGGKFLAHRCCQSGTLYLALEDGERRLKSRLEKLLNGRPAPPGFDFTTDAPTLSTGLVDALGGYVKQHPETGLIIVDTLQKVRDVGGGRDVYGRDYADIAVLKRFADTHNIAVVMVHHLRKMKDDGDPFNMISGTTGVSGAADTMLVLTKEKRGDETATLNITGRDVEMMELILKFNKSTCLWENLGDAEAFAEQQARAEYADSPIVKTVKKLLEQSPAGWTGTAQNLIDAGRFIAKTTLAPSAKALSKKLQELSVLFFEYDRIAYEYKRNGTGGGKHRFSYADTPQFEELVQSEIDPFR